MQCYTRARSRLSTCISEIFHDKKINEPLIASGEGKEVGDDGIKVYLFFTIHHFVLFELFSMSMYYVFRKLESFAVFCFWFFFL